MPYDEKTGKHYSYDEEGIEQYKKDTGRGMPMKNMSYWKGKNALPGIDPVSDESLPDGRSLSSPFQKHPSKERTRLENDLKTFQKQYSENPNDKTHKDLQWARQGLDEYMSEDHK